jgi:hypothetical protein
MSRREYGQNEGRWLAKDAKRVGHEPCAKAEIVALEPRKDSPHRLQATVKFDTTHPCAPKGKEIIVSDAVIFESYLEDGMLHTRRPLKPLKVGMRGVLRNTPNLRDGLSLNWQLVLDTE